MIAVIGDFAQMPSIELHRAAGFRMVGTFENVGFKFDRWLDSVLMQRALGHRARRTKAAMAGVKSYTATRLTDLSSARSTRSSSWPRRTIRPVADTTL